MAKDLEISAEVHADVEAVLEIIDTKLKKINKLLKKVEPIIQRRDKLMAARRALLAERSTTGGSGSPRTRLSMEEVVNAMRGIGKPASAVAIAEALSLDTTIVRSHLNRHKGTRYEQNGGGEWTLAEDEEDE